MPVVYSYGLPGNWGRCAASQATTSATSSDVMILAGQVPAPVGRTQIRPSGNDGRAQALIAHQGEIGTVDDGARATRTFAVMPWQPAHPFANSMRPRSALPGEGSVYGGMSSPAVARGFAHCPRMPVTSTSTCASVSMPPARREKAGIGVRGIPLAMAWRITSSLAIARYVGFARPSAAPPRPSVP